LRKFNLNIESYLQGNFELKDLNLAFIFQVNCPGCFIYGIPLVNELYSKNSINAGFIGISTAFEDFDYNTELHTKNLLCDGTLIGETKKSYQENFGIERYNHKINFPVAYDKLKEPNQFLTENNLTLICNSNPNYSIWPDWEKQVMRQKIKSYYYQFPKIAETFTLNQLQGTPSFVFFNEKYDLVKTFFDYQELEILDAVLKKY
jgi:hypothetical protein